MSSACCAAAHGALQKRDNDDALPSAQVESCTVPAYCTPAAVLTTPVPTKFREAGLTDGRAVGVSSHGCLALVLHYLDGLQVHVCRPLHTRGRQRHNQTVDTSLTAI